MPEVEEIAEDGLIKIELKPDDVDILVALFVSKNFSKESIAVFNECMSNDDGIEKSSFRAVLNEAIIEALGDQISRAMIAASKEACNGNVEP